METKLLQQGHTCELLQTRTHVQIDAFASISSVHGLLCKGKFELLFNVSLILFVSFLALLSISI